MLMRPRHFQVLEMLKQEPTALVRDLAVRMGVSESTVRRDLDDLESQGLVRRLYGGVVLQSQPQAQVEPPFEVREISQRREKDLIGRAAAALVQNGQVVFIDGGTTTEAIIPYLLERSNLTVVTCGLNIALALARAPHVSTILIGGELHVPSQSFTGPLALEILEAYRLRCNLAFIGTGGVSAQYGVTNRILDRIQIKRRAMAMSQHTAVVADSTKIGVVTLGHVAPIEAVHYLITDDAAPQGELARIAARGVTVKVAGADEKPPQATL